MWEAMEGKGVISLHPWWPSPQMETAELAGGLAGKQIETIREFLIAQEGKKYDWLAVARFVTRRKVAPHHAARRWFCSELAAAAFEWAGVPLLRMAPQEIAPGMLHASPILDEVPAFLAA